MTQTLSSPPTIAVPAADPAARWRVLQTRPRQEKALSRALAAAGVAHDPLLVGRNARHGGRKRWVETPLFPSYVVLHGPREDAFFAMETRRATRIIEIEDQAGFAREIAQIRRGLEAGAAMDPFPSLVKGARARVSRGPLKGLEGIVEDRIGVDRLILEVRALGRAVSVEIDPGLLDRA